LAERVRSAIQEMARHAIENSRALDDRQVEETVEMLLGAENIFVASLGHSGLVGRAFALRLMHLRSNVFVVGDVTTPGMKPDDIMVVITNSGETSSLIALSRKAKEVGGKVVAVTSCPESSLARIADHVVKIKPRGGIEKFPVMSVLGDGKHTQLSGTLFGVSTFLFLHGICCELAIRMKRTVEEIDERHANLE